MALSVNNERVDEQLIDAEVDRLKPKHDEAFRDLSKTERDRQLRDWATENVIDSVLLRQAAVRHIPPIANVVLQKAFTDLVEANGGEKRFMIQLRAQGLDRDRVLKDLDLQLRTERYIQSLHQPVAEPSDAEARAFFESHAQEFVIPELVRAGHIVLHVNESRTLGEAESIIAEAARELGDGASLEALAVKYSDCPDNDGDLGWFPRGEMVEEFEDVVFALEPGKTSGIIRSPFGLHIAKVYDHAAARPQAFEAVRQQIVQRLVAEKKERAVEAAVDALRATAVVSRA